MNRRPALLLCLLPAFCLPGCAQDKLETGYAYTPLGDSSVKRRGYYADPFSPEARAAQTETQQTDVGVGSGAARRPIPGQ